MKKEETIGRYSDAEYARRLEQRREWYKAHKEKMQTYNREYYEDHREEIKARSKEYYKEHPDEMQATNKKYKEEHPVKVAAAIKKWHDAHPEKVIAAQQEQHRKGGKYYERNLKKEQTGLRGERNAIRMEHNREFREIKATLAQEVELHHEWIGDTAEYRGMAFVEKKVHQQGIIDVILLLDGKITLLTEEEVKKGKKNE